MGDLVVFCMYSDYVDCNKNKKKNAHNKTLGISAAYKYVYVNETEEVYCLSVQ